MLHPNTKKAKPKPQFPFKVTVKLLKEDRVNAISVICGI
jgi:hypothetical protein